MSGTSSQRKTAQNKSHTIQTSYSMFKTRVVKIGDVPLGGRYPIRIQSMTTTNTMDTKVIVEQSVRIIEAGADYVRITAPSLKEAQNLEVIKKYLRKRGYGTPLIADIHYTPNAALLAARIVEKVRINPGNYADKRKSNAQEYNDIEYNSELERIRERIIPLIKVCKEYGTALRIGTNHGSLSDRILNRYGDTHTGMVESALEFVRICEGEGFYDIVLSMKASNPIIMVQANRLLVNKMREEDMNYPLHLGVTEAGEAEDGRIKSAVGIGTLLDEGIGDTIRVSLTEEPEHEIPAARSLVKRYENRDTHDSIAPIVNDNKLTKHYNPFSYSKWETRSISNIGGSNPPIVVADLSHKDSISPTDLVAAGLIYSTTENKWDFSDLTCDYIYSGDTPVKFKLTGEKSIICNYRLWLTINDPENVYPLFPCEEYFSSDRPSDKMNFVSVDFKVLSGEFLNMIKNDKTVVLVFETSNKHGMMEQRRMFFEQVIDDCHIPVIIKRNYDVESKEELLLHASIDCGGLFIAGFGDGIWINNQCPANLKNSQSHISYINDISFGILQATRTRITKTDYISCPSCGRTLFDLQETTLNIRKATDHLKGLKIGIMGCIVNGPGEMADADYGYVGTVPGKITLYKKSEVVRKNISSDKAVESLIDLIKENGDWVEKETRS